MYGCRTRDHATRIVSLLTGPQRLHADVRARTLSMALACVYVREGERMGRSGV